MMKGLTVPALVMAHSPRSSIGSAFATMAQKLHPDQSSDPYDVVWLDDLPEDPTEAGTSLSGIYLPRKCQSIEEWTNSPLVQGFRAKLR
jgi:hypothetical protein